ncbi:ATP-binding protein [Tenacibaculum sp. 190524A05c]
MEENHLSVDVNNDDSVQRLDDSSTTASNFFKGISYDFKTVVSLILSSTESLMNSNSNHDSKELNLIHDNANLLLKMVNQLLEFRKLENNEFDLKVSRTSISSLVSSVYSTFQKEAQKKKIVFSFNSNVNSLELFVDRELVRNMIFNLLSNAFKFTPIQGKISVDIYEKENLVCIAVKDSGIGISVTDKEKIFNQFYQGNNNQQSSSGIGLYLAKAYAELHKGTIEVISKENIGSEFIISLPKGEDHFSENQLIVEEDIQVGHSDSLTDSSEHIKEDLNSNEEIVLIIEDNDDLRFFLKSKLKKSYEVHESDGINVESKILETIPDVIVSDVNLPQKNGFELCEFVKNDERTSHIPVIMLTSLDTDEAHIKGLKSGVDMFLTKPFNLSVLSESIESLLYNRKQIQKYLKQLYLNTSKERPKKVEGKNKDKEVAFIGKLNELIQKNLDDSSFTVEILAEELHISRVQLYRKTKAVLGITISDYIQNIRLEKSKELLIGDNNLSIADIAYSVGFSSPNYFSTAFRNKYDQTPNEYKHAHKH